MVDNLRLNERGLHTYYSVDDQDDQTLDTLMVNEFDESLRQSISESTRSLNLVS